MSNSAVTVDLRRANQKRTRLQKTQNALWTGQESKTKALNYLCVVSIKVTQGPFFLAFSFFF